MQPTLTGSSHTWVSPIALKETITSPFWGASTKGVLVIDPIREPFPPREAPPDADDLAVRNYVSRLWAEDWDNPDDAVYDTW